MNKKRVIYSMSFVEAYIDETENIIVIEANWKDRDNTEEWFCHLGKDLENPFNEASYRYRVYTDDGRVYTDDGRWYVTANAKTGELKVHNVLYDFTVSLFYYCLNSEFRSKKKGEKNYDNT